MRTKHKGAAALLAAAVFGLGFAPAAVAQEALTAPYITEQMPVELDSGFVSNEGDGEAVVFTENIFIPGASSLRIDFDQVVLAGLISDGSASIIRIRSTLDGAEQRLDARHVEQWQNTSAYFNGDEVVVEIVAQPGTGDNRVSISNVRAAFGPPAESICGSTDDRLPSEDNRAARLLPIGCTGWLINDCNNCFLTAGHCTTSPSSFNVVEFNVPLSNSNGSLNHPPPEDQYALDVNSRQSNNGQGVGNDYAYFGVFPNSNTGLTPAEAYGEVYEVVAPPTVQGQEIRITGYGTTGSGVPGEWNQAQKTHVGPYFSFSGTTLQYQTDTTGGNSGSPVINEDTGQAIGIHTHAGCGTNSGNNGTGFNHPGLQNYLAAPAGVCACPIVDFFFPDSLPEFINPAGGDQITIEVLPEGDSVPQSGTGMFYYDAGNGFVAMEMEEVQANVYVATFPPVDCGTTVRYYFSAENTDGEIAYEPFNAPSGSFAAEAALGADVVIADDFQSDQGWTVQDESLATGSWDRGVPGDFGRGDPGSDFDGSGSCYVTGNSNSEDVDGGPTRLTSPVLDLTSNPLAAISYARWFYNDDNDADSLVVEVSDNGGSTWVTVETIGNQNGWEVASFVVADYVETTANVVVRFSASDNPNDSVTEAAIDDFRVFTYICDDGCAGDFNDDGDANTLDVLDFLNAWSAQDDSADFNDDGDINTVDVLDFLNAWNAGC